MIEINKKGWLYRFIYDRKSEDGDQVFREAKSLCQFTRHLLGSVFLFFWEVISVLTLGVLLVFCLAVVLGLAVGSVLIVLWSFRAAGEEVLLGTPLSSWPNSGQLSLVVVSVVLLTAIAIGGKKLIQRRLITKKRCPSLGPSELRMVISARLRAVKDRVCPPVKFVEGP